MRISTRQSLCGLGMKRNANFDSVTSATGTPQESQIFNGDIGQWDVVRVTDMGFLFSRASQFHQDIGQWDVSNVTSMGRMFEGAASYRGVRWTSEVGSD
jgi:surface protein